MCEFRLVPIAIVVYGCELGGEMAFCYHLGCIYFRIASRPFSVASVFKTEKIGEEAIAKIVSIQQISNIFTNSYLYTFIQ